MTHSCKDGWGRLGPGLEATSGPRRRRPGRHRARRWRVARVGQGFTSPSAVPARGGDAGRAGPRRLGLGPGRRLRQRHEGPRGWALPRRRDGSVAAVRAGQRHDRRRRSNPRSRPRRGSGVAGRGRDARHHGPPGSRSHHRDGSSLRRHRPAHSRGHRARLHLGRVRRTVDLPLPADGPLHQRGAVWTINLDVPTNSPVRQLGLFGLTPSGA